MTASGLVAAKKACFNGRNPLIRLSAQLLLSGFIFLIFRAQAQAFSGKDFAKIILLLIFLFCSGHFSSGKDFHDSRFRSTAGRRVRARSAGTPAGDS
ncbi:hypothetical protein KJ068_20305 [bacterium]|nr:hypothetical protein [bacterium]